MCMVRVTVSVAPSSIISGSASQFKEMVLKFEIFL